MAIRYDTPEDFERDKLKEQALRTHLAAEQQARSGLGWLIISSIPSLFNNVPRWVRWTADVMGVVGIIGVVRSWFTTSKAHNLELERERLGPQMVVLPDGAAARDVSCGCSLKSYTDWQEPKTHMDYAAKSMDSLSLKN